MATHVLSSDTPISSLMPSGGGTLASGDTIELSGHDLIVDSDAANYPVTLSNAGAAAHMELRNGGRIGLNATLPTSICPWVDPEHPLPESNYTAGLTGNASAEIQFRANISLGGGPASLPTATRPGNFWAIVLSSDSTTTLQFDRDFPLHAGDYIANLMQYNAIQRVKVASYDSATHTATLETALSRRTVGDTWSLVAGGVCLHKVSTSSWNATWLTSPASGGTLTLFSPAVTTNIGTVFGDNAIFDRVLWGGCGSISGATNSVFSADAKTRIVGQLACGLVQIGASSASFSFSNSSCIIGELATCSYAYDGNCIYSQKNVVSHRGIINATFVNKYSGIGNFCFTNTSFKILPTVTNNAQVRLIDCTVDGVSLPGDTTYLSTGTVTRVLRSDFPVDTDLPDAFYYAPATAADVPWRYEDYWVRKGETLRVSCRAMRGGDDAKALVAIGKMEVWVPSDGMPVLAEWRCEGGQALEWQGGSLEWTNDTGEDCQVRLWSMATGANGGYLRVWRATGGAM